MNNLKQHTLLTLGGVTVPHPVAFWFGVIAVTAGVIAHLPMYLMGKDNGYKLVGMPMDMPMMMGMAAIIVGLVASLYGLYPRSVAVNAGMTSKIRVSALDDAPLNATHVGLLLAMAMAVMIDIMKPTALAFVMPGMTLEYGLKSPLNPNGTFPAVWVALAGIMGTVMGSFLWGWLGDKIGRRASILYAGIGFIGTSICGAMPDFYWNLVMCFLMGLAVGGMLPICYALLAETIPARHRGWLMILIGADIAGAYILTSWIAVELVPTYSWRILWLIGLPTGVLFIMLNRWIPESPRFLLINGREAEARAVMARYGAVVALDKQSKFDVESVVKGQWSQLISPQFLGTYPGRRFPRPWIGTGVVRLQSLDSDQPSQVGVYRSRRDTPKCGYDRLSFNVPGGVDVWLLEQQENHYHSRLTYCDGFVRFCHGWGRDRAEPCSAVRATGGADLGNQFGGCCTLGLQFRNLPDSHPCEGHGFCRWGE